MTDDLPEIRTSPPYIMYDMMKETGKALESTLKTTENRDINFKRGGVTVTGNGTSYHAGVMGFQFISNSEKLWNGIQSYELEKYSYPLGNILAISHTGKTYSTIQSIKRHNSVNSIGVSHFADSPLIRAVNIPIVIEDKDESLCNTKAFFDNALASAIVAKKYEEKEYDFKGLVDKLTSDLAKADSTMNSIADEMPVIEKIFVLGAGKNFIAARETAQKLKEATHIHSEGIEMEEYNHGCTSVTDDKTLILIIQNNQDSERVKQITSGIKYVNAKSLVINGEGDFSVEMDYKDELELPLETMAYTYMFAYHMAVKLKVNPDILRFDEKEYYDFDMAIFPPGHH